MNGHHLLAISDGHKEGKIKVPILPNEPDYGFGSFSIDDRRYHVNTTIRKDGREDNVFDILLTLTPKEMALNIKVLQPDGKAPIEGIRVELKGKIQQFTNPEGTAQFIVKASPDPVTIVIQPTDIYQGEEFTLTVTTHGGSLKSRYNVDVRERGQTLYATVKLQQSPKDVEVILKDNEGNRLKKTMEVEIGKLKRTFDINGEIYIPENLLNNIAKVTLKYEDCKYLGHLLLENDGYAIKLSLPFLDLNVRVENLRRQQIRKFKLNGEEKTVKIGEDVPVRLTGLYGKKQELNIESGIYQKTAPIVLIQNQKGDTTYEIENKDNPMLIKEDDKHLTVRLLTDWLVETIRVSPPEPNLEILLAGKSMGITNENGEVQPLFLEKKQLRLNSILIKKDGINKPPIRLEHPQSNLALIYLELLGNFQK